MGSLCFLQSAIIQSDITMLECLAPKSKPELNLSVDFKRIVPLKFANSMVKVKQVQVQYTVCMYGIIFSPPIRVSNSPAFYLL